MLRSIHERRGGLPIPELYEYWPNVERPDTSALHWIKRMNDGLVPLGWRLLRIANPETKEALGLCEILRNEQGRRNARAGKPE